jgi:hypothetical protein
VARATAAALAIPERLRAKSPSAHAGAPLIPVNPVRGRFYSIDAGRGCSGSRSRANAWHLARRAQSQKAAMPSTATADVVVTSPATGAATREMRCVGTWNVHAIADLERRLSAVAWPREGEKVHDSTRL